MTESEFKQARTKFIAEGALVPELLEGLKTAASETIKYGGFPAFYSPTGNWDDEAIDEVLADWIADRLIGTDQLAAILHRASTHDAFVRIGKEALRRNLGDRLERTQARSLYARLVSLLEEDDEFESIGASHWRLTGSDASPWQENERALLGVAWGLGEFATVTYREDAKKLSPLLERPELKRFVVELFGASESALSQSQIIRVIEQRFDLVAIEIVELDAVSEPGTEDEASDDSFETRDPAKAASDVIDAITDRQEEVLKMQLDYRSTREIASALKVSVGTVSADQSEIARTIREIGSADFSARVEILNALRDRLFIK